MDVRAIRFEPVRVSLAELALHRRDVNRKGQADLSADFTIARKNRHAETTSNVSSSGASGRGGDRSSHRAGARRPFGWDRVVDLKQLCVPSAQATEGHPTLPAFGGGKTGMRKIVALVVLIVLLGGFGIEVGARAYRLRQCNRYAKVVRGMAQERDSGVSSDVMRARLKATEAAQTEPDPGIHDLMGSTITAIYGHPELTPDQCAAVALDGCLTHR